MNPWRQDAKWSDKVAGGTDTYVDEYHRWVAANYDTYNDDPMLCNWFPLKLLVEFAAAHGLRVRLRYWPGSAPTNGGERAWDTSIIRVHDSHGGSFATKEAFYTKVKATVTARMIGQLNTVGIRRADANAGDLLIYDRSDRYWHAEVIVKATAAELTRQSGTTPAQVPQDRELTTGGGSIPQGTYGNSPRRWAVEQFEQFEQR
jgi:hypothetical protein